VLERQGDTSSLNYVALVVSDDTALAAAVSGSMRTLYMRYGSSKLLEAYEA
jgi:hypothetical protein